MVTNPTRMALPERADLRRALAAVGGKAADYAPSPMGERWVREAVAADLAALDRRPPTPADRLLLTASTSEAYGILFRVLADPGEAVLVPQPSYPLFDHLLRFAGLVPAPYPLRFDGDRRVVDPAELAQAQARAPAPPRALIAVAPNNPTGSYLSPADVRALASTGLPLIVDEVFRHHPVVLDRPPPRAGELLAGSKSLVCSLGGASKHLALPQLKVAWTEVGGPDGLVRELVERFELVADATLDLAPPMAAALAALLPEGDRVRAGMGERLRAHRDLLRERLDGSPGSVDGGGPEGGWSAVLRLPATRSSDAWARLLLDEDDVLVQPGWLYDMDDEDARLVVSLGTPPKTFAEGVDRLVARIAADVAALS